MKKIIQWVKSFGKKKMDFSKEAKMLRDALEEHRLREAGIVFKVDVPLWHDGHANALEAFFMTEPGQAFVQHLKKYQIEMCEWAVSVTDPNFKAGRAEVAHGVKLAHENLLRMAKKQKETKKIDPNQVQEMINRRMSIPMGAFKT